MIRMTNTATGAARRAIITFEKFALTTRNRKATMVIRSVSATAIAAERDLATITLD